MVSELFENPGVTEVIRESLFLLGELMVILGASDCIMVLIHVLLHGGKRGKRNEK